MKSDPIQKVIVESQKEEIERCQPIEAAKTFVKPTLTRHDSLPRVTLLGGGGSP